MVKISEEDILKWHRRIFGAPDDKDLKELHHALRDATTSLYGCEGMASLALRSGYEVWSDEPEDFEYHSIRIHLGDVVIFAHLFTTCELLASNEVEGRDIRVILVEKGIGTSEIIVDGVKSVTQNGIPAYLSTQGKYHIISKGLSDGFGVVLPGSMAGINTGDVAGIVPPTPYTAAAFSFLRTLLGESINQMYTNDRIVMMAPDARKALKSLLRAIFQQEEQNGEDARTEQIRQRVRELVEANHRNPDFSVSDLAEQMHMSRRQLYRYFTDNDGVAGMLAARRAYTARVYMEHHPELSISEIASRSGFLDATRLREHFKRTFNMLPSEYRTRFEFDGRILNSESEFSESIDEPAASQ